MLDYTTQQRIARDVILGVPAPAGEPEEAAAWRQQVEADVAKAKQMGVMPDLPFDWDAQADAPT